MAKKTGNVQDQIVDWAEDLGRLLGTAESRAKGWLQQRQDVAKSLEQIRDTANSLLSELQGTATAAADAVRRRGRPPASSKATTADAPAAGSNAHYPGVSKKGGMSEEGRQRVAEAQRARWAKIRLEREKADRFAKRKGGSKRTGGR
jgi:ABC-type transporter Mla subunit MlaD